MNQRKYIRLDATDMEVAISDKIGLSTGTLKDISRFGIGITNIPRKIKTKEKLFTVILSGNGQRFRLQLEPKWMKEDGPGISTGATIANAPWDWTAMLIQLEPKDEDIWAVH